MDLKYFASPRCYLIVAPTSSRSPWLVEWRPSQSISEINCYVKERFSSYIENGHEFNVIRNSREFLFILKMLYSCRTGQPKRKSVLTYHYFVPEIHHQTIKKNQQPLQINIPLFV